MAIPFSLPLDGNSSRQKIHLPSKPKEVIYHDNSQSNSLVLAAMVEAFDFLHCIASGQGQDTDIDSDSTSDIKESQQTTPFASHGMSNTFDLHTNKPNIIKEAEVVTGNPLKIQNCTDKIFKSIEVENQRNQRNRKRQNFLVIQAQAE